LLLTNFLKEREKGFVAHEIFLPSFLLNFHNIFYVFEIYDKVQLKNNFIFEIILIIDKKIGN